MFCCRCLLVLQLCQVAGPSSTTLAGWYRTQPAITLEVELAAAAQRRNCPPLSMLTRDTRSVAFLHIPKTGGELPSLHDTISQGCRLSLPVR